MFLFMFKSKFFNLKYEVLRIIHHSNDRTLYMHPNYTLDAMHRHPVYIHKIIHVHV